MMESRTKKSLRNSGYSLLLKIVDIVFTFVLRTIFIHALGVSYLGLSGLFANVLTVLSLMELGVGGAIVFSLYEPMAQGRHGKVAALMQLYKKVYCIIGIAVLIIGFSLTPFLKYLINLPNEVDYLYLIYWISVINTAVSYFFAYRRSLLLADQRSDINSKNQLVFRTTRFLVLSAILLVSHNYVLYLIFDVINTIASNIQINYWVKKNYYFIEKASVEPLEKNERKAIRKFMASGIFFKFGQTIVNSTDNIIISSLISTVLVGFYSNYCLVTANLETFIAIFFSGITASVGNYAVTETAERSHDLFNKVWFVNYVIVFYLSVCIFCLITPFVKLWIGEQYTFDTLTVAILTINFYIASLQKGTESFLSAMGEMFYRNRYRSLIEGLVNLVVSIVLVKYFSLGITGVLLGTTICFIFGRCWMDSFTLHKYWFKKSFASYVLKYISSFVLLIITGYICMRISNCLFITLGLSVFSWILCGVCISIIVFALLWVLFHRRIEFSYAVDLVKNKLMRH